MRYQVVEMGRTFVIYDEKTGAYTDYWSTVRAEMEQLASRKNRRTRK